MGKFFALFLSLFVLNCQFVTAKILDRYYEVDNNSRLRDSDFFTAILGHDTDMDVYSFYYPKHSKKFLVDLEAFKKIRLGMTRSRVAKEIQNEEDSVYERLSLIGGYPYKNSNNEFVPIDKYVYYMDSVYRDKMDRGKEYRLELFFYRDRLMDYTYLISDAKSYEVIFEHGSHDHRPSRDLGIFYFTKMVNYKRLADDMRKYLPKESMSKCYWEAPDFEETLRKSGYYDYKAKLDKDFEEKKGYWTPTNCRLFDKYFCD
jgi:hypothetical protein